MTKKQNERNENKTVNEQVADAVVKRGRGRPKGTGGNKRPDISEKQTVKTNPGDNTQYINHSLRLAKFERCDFSNPEQVAERCDTYFKICAEDDMKPSVAGLALCLGIERIYLYELRTGQKGKSPEVANILKKAVAVLDLQMVDYMQNGKINPVSGIFLMKNNFGYKDQQEVVVTPRDPLGEETDEARLADKYAESVVVDDADFTDVTQNEQK